MSERTPPDLKTVGDFLRRFAFWNEERSQHRFAEFARGTSRLLVALRVIKDQWRETERLASQSFNIFRALRVECRETSHSAFLAELLDPRGRHGQGLVFLRRFLELLADRKSRHGLAFPVLDPTTCRVHVEKEIGSVRADILLDFSDALILIENKIYAEETPEQICRYARWLRVTQGARKTALLFLTLEGKEAISAGSEDYFRISYQRDIIPWLLACRNEVVSARVRDTLEQYVNAVDFLMGGSDMTTYDREVIEFLARKENIADALEVYRHMPEVKRKLKSDYWKDCRERLEELLRSERPEGWTIRETGDVETPNSTIQLTQNVLPSGVRCFSFALDVDKDRISVGILFSEQELPWSKEVKDLASELEKDGFKREKQWWVGWVEVENMGDDDFYLRMAENPAKVVQRTVGPLWQLFNKHRSEISKINEGLSSAKS